VLGTVAGAELGKGAFQLTSDVVDYVRRPHGLLGAKDVYALYVEGESMLPKFEPGDLVFVHPHRKPRNGDYVVIQEPDSDNGGPRGFIKRLVAVTTKLIRTEQFNPKSNIDFVIRPGLQVHKVMTDGELYGV
jgi:phage repressor protein C with HTH and peptisase S24 domain